MGLYGPVHKIFERSAYATQPPITAPAYIPTLAKRHFTGSYTKLVYADLINC